MPTNYQTAVMLIIGAVIGAGVFGIPYSMSQSGILFGILNLIFVGFIVLSMTLFMGEIVLRTKGKMQFTALAEKYLGKWGKWTMFFSMAIGIYGALTAYLVGIGESITHLLGGNPIIYSIIFFVLATPLIYFGLKTVTKVEFGLSAFLVAIFIIISISLLPHLKFQNISYNNPKRALYPYGVILFATLGYPIIPEVTMILKRNEKKIMSAIAVAMISCLSIYALFSVSMIGTFGENVSEIATNSLKGTLGDLGTIVAILAMATGFLALGIVLKDVYHLDLRINPKLSWGLVILIPMLIFISFSPSFITAILLTGTYSGGLAGVISALMVKEARKKSELKPKYVVPGGNFLIYFSIAVFVFGIIYQTIRIFA